eukprot:CAMPEP_0119475298 /NCGR_PEP_ID=MMETSP1344-20130328/6235_1 /TAXON_ID=236787 /ORGANISM="Florenciella parvula, Strain CCMP2471" /LENGTH=48 /DNA_ID= /DNA_START= /DNA_END= /DNA_ORIENTATION=
MPAAGGSDGRGFEIDRGLNQCMACGVVRVDAPSIARRHCSSSSLNVGS